MWGTAPFFSVEGLTDVGGWKYVFVKAWDSGRGDRGWIRGESLQGWGNYWSGMFGEFVPNLRFMHTPYGTVLHQGTVRTMMGLTLRKVATP
jgi:hypothetical protein